ncbi:MAG: HAD family phosphatase [Syntrophaceae bacterium]|nr:HAD family phosphatase [Syntrophaceae bacterium]
MSKSNKISSSTEISTIFFDYGGVIAAEGFREGLFSIARLSNMDEKAFFELATECVYETGYVTGKVSESFFWNALRNLSGISLTNEVMRQEILSRFLISSRMIQLVRMLRRKNITVNMLSDQTNWLDELDHRDHFYCEFDHIFNSYYLGKSKRDVTIFTDVLDKLRLAPQNALFIDDNYGHTQRASSVGIATITFNSEIELLNELNMIGLVNQS